jgi:hypothetical protein
MSIQQQIQFIGFVLSLGLVALSPYSAFILALFIVSGLVTDWAGLWMFAVAGYTLAFIFRLANPRKNG